MQKQGCSEWECVVLWERRIPGKGHRQKSSEVRVCLGKSQESSRIAKGVGQEVSQTGVGGSSNAAMEAELTQENRWVTFEEYSPIRDANGEQQGREGCAQVGENLKRYGEMTRDLTEEIPTSVIPIVSTHCLKVCEAYLVTEEVVITLLLWKGTDLLSEGKCYSERVREMSFSFHIKGI